MAMTSFIEGDNASWTTDPRGFKASKSNPDTPSHWEAMGGPHLAEFKKAIQVDLASIESMNTWTPVERANLPPGTNVVQVMWDHKI